jgi:hypothetical protein
MVDSVRVFDPGFRVTDELGNPVNNAQIKFRHAGPGGTKTVYSDAELTTPLGHTVRTRSDGQPCVSEGNSTTTHIYVDANAYHIEITDEDDNPIAPAIDNVRGAVDTSLFATLASLTTFALPVVALTGDQTLGTSYAGKALACDPTSGSFTLTLDAATTLGDKWAVAIRHTGTQNYVKIAASQTISLPQGARNAFSLRKGEGCIIICDGATFHVFGYVPAWLLGTVGMIEIVDRVASAPVSPNPGARYIATAIFTSGGVTTAVGDIIEATGQSTFIKITPPADCGWAAYVQSEDEVYQYQGSAWVQLLTAAASQAVMEAASSLLKVVTPGRQHFHPGHLKACGFVAVSGGAPTLSRGYNIASITDNGVGDFTLNFTNAMSDTTFGCVATPHRAAPGSSRVLYCVVIAKATGSVRIATLQEANTAGTNASFLDDLDFSFEVTGDM